ncbi:hypothetical protein [Kribbella solani]|uniref:hypothetical protein n=1 Tax=Kribbella solani TaxID=236067 RepID=UPI0029A708A7|nr:hypothetical protein [Kribbella solani]MDX2968863.1 hypothetical protein [Kribbella solani]
MADERLDDIQAIVARRLVDRVEHHADTDTGLRNDQLGSPDAVMGPAAETMMARSSIPPESRPAAKAAIVTMLTEGFNELPARLADWRLEGADAHVRREAERFGAGLGDQTMAAVRTFEVNPPNPADLLAEEQAASAANESAASAGTDAASVGTNSAAASAGTSAGTSARTDAAASVGTDPAAAFVNDPAVPPLRGVQNPGGEQRGAAHEHPRSGHGSAGVKRDAPGGPAR